MDGEDRISNLLKSGNSHGFQGFLGNSLMPSEPITLNGHFLTRGQNIFLILFILHPQILELFHGPNMCLIFSISKYFQ